MGESDNLAGKFYDALVAINRVGAAEIAAEAASDGLGFIESAVVPALVRIGTDWERGAIALSQVYLGSRIAEQVVDGLLPATATERRRKPMTAIAVLEDYHLLGKRIVYAALRAAGFELLDFGAGLSPEALVRKTVAARIRVLLISTLMLPSALRIRDVRRLLDEEGVQVKIVAGGAPFRFDPKLGRDVGADAVGDSAADAVTIVRRIFEEAP